MSFDCVLAAWHRHEAELRGFLVGRVRDVDDVDDVLQDVFLKSMREGADFCRLDNPRAWLFRVARNALVDRFRVSRPQEEIPEHLVALEDDGRAPVDELDACMRRNLQELAPEDRQVIEACDLGGMRQQAFAEASGLSLAAVKSRLLRARQRLRDALVSNCQVRFDDSGSVCCHVPRR